MKLFANGCSMTWGGEIVLKLGSEDGRLYDHADQRPENLDRLTKVWPHHLAGLLGADECVNMSMGCGSNARILRTTMEFFGDKIAKGERVSDWLCVIQFTEPSRFEVYDEDRKLWLLAKNGIIAPPTPDSVKKTILSRYLIWTEHQGKVEFARDAVSLAAFLKLFGIPYVFTSMTCELTDTDQGGLFDLARSCRWLGGSLANASMYARPFDRLPGQHLSETGHREFAAHVFDWIMTGQI